MTVSRPGPWREDGFDPAPPTAEQMAEQEAILADQLAAGWPGPPPGELVDFCPDPDTGLPEDDHAALGELPEPGAGRGSGRRCRRSADGAACGLAVRGQSRRPWTM